MNIQVVQRLLGILLMGFSLTLPPPALLGIGYGEREIYDFLYSFLMIWGEG